jgi:hypothetical protein
VTWPGGDSQRSGEATADRAKQGVKAGTRLGVDWLAQSGSTGEYLAVGCSVPATTVGVFVQQECDLSICELPHWSAMCRQQSFSSSLIARPGKVHASNGAESTVITISKWTDLRRFRTSIVCDSGQDSASDGDHSHAHEWLILRPSEFIDV